jgi:translation elongation factor EF-Ts
VLGSPSKYLTEEAVPKEELERQIENVKKIMEERLAKVPEHQRENIITGKLRSMFYEQHVMTKMGYLLSNNEISVETYWKE